MRRQGQPLDYLKFSSLISKALDGRNTFDGERFIWHAADGCECPVDRVFYSAPPRLYIDEWPYQYMGHSVRYLTIEVPCRKCGSCLAARAKLWRSRAYYEVRHAQDAGVRTWWCTFTLAPEHRVRAHIRASRRYGNEDFSSLTKIIYSDFQLFLKRLRKRCKTRLRYVCVFEAHKDGFPHIHSLIHEVPGFPSMGKRDVQGEWPYGHSCVKLSQPEIVTYVTKYLAKDMRARVRASIRYGHGLAP